MSIEISSLSYTYANRSAPALRDVSLTCRAGEITLIAGKSGSGKSTLLSLLGALDKPTSGDIVVGGSKLSDVHFKKLTDYRRREIGFIFQNYHLVPNLTALENVCLPMEFAHVGKTQRTQRAQKLLDEVGISGDKQGRLPGRLSGGEQQRVAIARALANHPKLVLADEPTGNLDEQTGKMIFDLLHTLSRQEKVTIVVVTHDLDIAGKTDVTFRLADGKLVAKKA